MARFSWSTRILAGIVAFLACLPFLFQSDPFIFIFLANTFLFMILALGLQLIFGFAGMIHLSHAAFFGIGAYASALVTRDLQWPFLAGVLTSVAAAVLVGLLISPIVRLKSVYFALASFSVGPVTQVFMRELPFTGGANGLGQIPPASVAGFGFATPVHFYYLSFSVLVAFYVLCHLLSNSPFGVSLRAIRQNELLAASCGINVPRNQIKVFLIGVAAAGLAGSLVAHVQGFISPDMFSVEKSLFVLGIVVVGGLGSLPGAILGSGIMMFIAEYSRFFREYTALVYGLILVLFMIFFPRGLWALLTAAVVRLTSTLKRERTRDSEAVQTR